MGLATDLPELAPYRGARRHPVASTKGAVRSSYLPNLVEGAVDYARDLNFAPHPDIPQLHNYLYIARYDLDEHAEAARAMEETVRRFPDDPFGRIA